MKLQNFLGTAEKWGYEAIANDVELSQQIQVLLIGLRLLEP